LLYYDRMDAVPQSQRWPRMAAPHQINSLTS
jgi:hypothetical protein